MPRTSIDELMITESGLAAAIPRPDAPYDLDEREVDVWRAIVNSMPADHFIPANYHVLTQLCRHVVEARWNAHNIKTYRKRKTADFNYKVYGELQKAQIAESQIIARLSTTLRLTQQSTFSQKAVRLHRPITISNKPEEW
jgi:hypothetical protein